MPEAHAPGGDVAHRRVDAPLWDFFCNGWNTWSQVSSVPVGSNPNGGFNAYWPMPFRRAAWITLENLSADPVTLYYQVDYELAEIPEDAQYFHAQWRRSHPVPAGEVHTLLDGVDARAATSVRISRGA